LLRQQVNGLAPAERFNDLGQLAQLVERLSRLGATDSTLQRRRRA
jgi:hypothetical protein